MIKLIATVDDPFRGLLLHYMSDGQHRWMAITPTKNRQWKRWIFASREAQ